MDKWEAAAAKIHEDVYCQSLPTAKIAPTPRGYFFMRRVLPCRCVRSGESRRLNCTMTMWEDSRQPRPVVLALALAADR